ncbi:PREDICTED: uncharacterized protein LOC108561088 [Nicrophorus vespilloides]|uniref:Uncharacterized protein LOC108561088 n=1 Tax=Nicrophorus vespilloides TaxID=110193 RepID=A0ABM1MIG8_NICVS|nr:PREDICTED: uncharacterized protein LOC108561088 [Nicrophorus vespilloides]
MTTTTTAMMMMEAKGGPNLLMGDLQFNASNKRNGIKYSASGSTTSSTPTPTTPTSASFELRPVNFKNGPMTNVNNNSLILNNNVNNSSVDSKKTAAVNGFAACRRHDMPMLIMPNLKQQQQISSFRQYRTDPFLLQQQQQQRDYTVPGHISRICSNATSSSSSPKSWTSVGMGCTDGKKMIVKRVPTSPNELFNIVNPPT